MNKVPVYIFTDDTRKIHPEDIASICKTHFDAYFSSLKQGCSELTINGFPCNATIVSLIPTFKTPPKYGLYCSVCVIEEEDAS